MFIIENQPKSCGAEAYRELKSNIQYSAFDKKYKSIVVTSPLPGEGKSTTASNLALAFSQGGKKVLLLDCDMRKPTLHKKFKISNINGLSDILVGDKVLKDVAKKYNSNLTILTGGKIPPNPSEMLESKIMENFIEEMKNYYDYIIIDTAPINIVTDAKNLAAVADGVVLVVKARSTKRNDIIQSIESINKVNGKIIGTVLNAKKQKANKYSYYYNK